uniref:Serine/threonine kinase 33 n=1 Tax=Neolamprologus brichardi TaxID=32507 RepID=A0A3Q4H973_NEOBR
KGSSFKCPKTLFGHKEEIYKFENKLGQGAFGVVYEATHIETQTKWAIKTFCRPPAGSSKVEMVDNEINLLKQMNHAHIIHLEWVNVMHVTYHCMIYLVTELCKGGDLRELLQRKKFFTEDETRDIICSLADAVVHLHKRDIVHRDLKLENILVKNSPDEDGDKIDVKTKSYICAFVLFPAPEMMSGRGYTQWCDVWSIGVIMYMLLCGEPPFVSKTRKNLLKKIMNTGVKFSQPIWASVSDAAKNLLTCLLKVDPAYRMSANQLLENPWITGDSTMPVVPPNVLEMMLPVHPAFSAETNSNCMRHSSSDISSTSTKLVMCFSLAQLSQHFHITCLCVCFRTPNVCFLRSLIIYLSAICD